MGIGLLVPQRSPAQSITNRVSEHIRTRIEAASTNEGALMVADQPIYARDALARFYEQRGFQPAWSTDRGPTARGDSLLAAVEQADRHGLHPGDYHIRALRAMRAEARTHPPAGVEERARQWADLELLFTDAFLLYGSHLWAGRVDPETIDPGWKVNPQDTDLVQRLDRAVTSGVVKEALDPLAPPQPEYTVLKAALSRYRRIQQKGGWPAVPNGPTLHSGDEGARVEALRERLRATGDWAAVGAAHPARFDSTLDAAVRHFQARNGLDADGVVGSATLAALNVPVEERVNQLRINMERWRWLPRDLGRRHIIVNIAGFDLRVVEEGADVLRMRVVAGRPYRQTPVFSDQITYLVFNPYWHVPHSIAVNDKLPLIKKNPGYLTQQNMKVFKGWGADAQPIDPKTIDWTKVTASNFPYRLRQDPGPNNALGRVKFMLPNKYSVYLHDTPSRELFAQSERPFSSGCIRLEKPMELAEYLLADQPEWTPQHIRQVLGEKGERTVRLQQPIPVHLLYWTAWVEDEGTIHFRRDIYNRDAHLLHALDAPLPFASSR